ncbi:hypothetical protein [Streptomyces sp. NPDC047042]|uniref:hypothetical protein n=1 Tax=Streptomyces sp. NPDC047042 TaxID=3154807 RepID=UPI0033F07A10
MNLRILRIELKRSVAPWAGAVVLTGALGFLYLVNAGWWRGTTAWTAQWTTLALWTRTLLFYLWPIAVGLGALQGLRDHRSKTVELLTSTPRPAWHRAATSAGTTAVTLASAFALLVLVGGVQVLANTEYTHLGWLPISLVGALSLVAGAVLGMGVARALPSALTPPAMAMGAFVFTVLMSISHSRTETNTPGFPINEPTRISLLSPAVQEVRDALLTLSGAVHAGQTIWLLGMAATGFALLMATAPRIKVIALAPVLAGGIIALLILPSDPRRIYVMDETAAELVCEGPVCVTRTQQARLADLADPGRKALGLMRGALGGRAPVSVREDNAVLLEGSTPRWSREAVLFDFDDHTVASAKGEELTRALIVKGMVPGCTPVGWESFDLKEAAAQSIAVAWVLGKDEPVDSPSAASSEVRALARPAWKKLRALPRAEQLSRINAMRTAALSCKGDPLDALSGGAAR